MDAVVQPKPRARYAAKRDAIMAAATQVFADQGMSGFTLAAVAKRMDLHPVSLTYYFKRKEDLAAAVLHDTMLRFGEMLTEAEAKPTPQERLRTYVAAYFEVRRQVIEEGKIPLAPFSEINLIEGDQHGALMEAYRALYVRTSRLLKAPDMPWMTPPRRAALTRLLISQLTWSDAWLDNYEPSDYGRVADRIVDVMIGGLAAQGQAWPDLPLLDLAPPVAQNDEVTRDRFLVAATKLINREGYRGASVDKISAELKVTKGSFYHHNADKDELAAACFCRTFDLIDEAKREASSIEPGWTRLWLATMSLAMHQGSGEYGLMLRHYAIAAVPPSMRRTMLTRFRQIAHSFAGIISDGVADGSIRAVDPLLASRYVMVVFNSCLPLDARSNPGEDDNLIDSYLRPALLGCFSE